MIVYLLHTIRVPIILLINCVFGQLFKSEKFCYDVEYVFIWNTSVNVDFSVEYDEFFFIIFFFTKFVYVSSKLLWFHFYTNIMYTM